MGSGLPFQDVVAVPSVALARSLSEETGAGYAEASVCSGSQTSKCIRIVTRTANRKVSASPQIHDLGRGFILHVLLAFCQAESDGFILFFFVRSVELKSNAL